MGAMSEPAVVAKETVTVTVDGRTFEARPGELVIAAAERHGVYIPRFCWHPRMKPVGMCRMCLVEIDGVRGLPPACTTPVAEGMVVHSTSPGVKKAQDGVLEFLLINHPLDCPVCDRGGECPLQDQTFAFGPGESRFIEEKRHFEKPIPISDLVALDRERCILCARCTRFADEVAGDPLIAFHERGNETQVLTFPDDPFTSYFSGNTVQICPVGALTATPYRFRARPWDLEQVESTCTTCSVGCRIAAQSSSNRLVRYLGVDAEPTNHGWLCDKGRFGFEAVNSDARLRAPLVREEGRGLVETSWSAALDAAADGLREARDRHGAGAIAVLGGARLANEDAYAWTKLAKAVLGTDNVDCQLGDGLPAEVVLGLPRATIDDACWASAVILLAPDLKEELPVLYLRLREAAVERGTVLVELSPQRTGLSRHAQATLLYRPGEAAALAAALVGGNGDIAWATGVATADIAAARRLLEGHDDVVVVIGRPSLAESQESIAEAAAVLAARLPNARFLPALRRGNVHGALDMGLAPGVLPGRVTFDDARAWFTDAWGAVLPGEPGLDAHGILRAAADGHIHALVLLGVDPLVDFPDRVLARLALGAAGTVIAVDLFATDSVQLADVVLPAAAFAERPGTTTNLEGRISRLGQKVTAPGTARPDWMIAVELAARLGVDLGFDSPDAIWSEIEQVAPAHAGITLDLLRDIDERDGVVVPLDGRSDRAARTTAEADEADRVIEAIETRAAASQGEGVVTLAAAGAAPVRARGAAGPRDGRRRPPLLHFAPRDDVAAPPVLDAYAVRLVSGRSLYDQGAMVQRCPSMAHLAPGPRVRANPHDIERLGLASGDRVRLVTSRSTIDLPVTAWSGVPQGSISITFNQRGDIAAADIIDASTPVTDVRMESPE
jgi:NADH-quinone oxidoreductase subunit G